MYSLKFDGGNQDTKGPMIAVLCKGIGFFQDESIGAGVSGQYFGPVDKVADSHNQSTLRDSM